VPQRSAAAPPFSTIEAAIGPAVLVGVLVGPALGVRTGTAVLIGVLVGPALAVPTGTVVEGALVGAFVRRATFDALEVEDTARDGVAAACEARGGETRASPAERMAKAAIGTTSKHKNNFRRVGTVRRRS
jgi:hypothetical protein